MKHTFKWATLFATMLIMLLPACKPEENADSMEALIKSIKIVNAGLSGGDIIQGDVDNTGFVVTFNNVPAETNIAAVKFQTSLSLGAKMDAETYDFTEGNEADAMSLTRTVKVINDPKVQEYKVIMNLKEAEKAPILERLVMKDDKGLEHTLTAQNVIDGILCLGMPEAASAEFVSIALSPVRAAYTFTAATDGRITANNPGKLHLSFMGKETEYEISFAASPTPGADFSKAIVHDFTHMAGNRYMDFDEEFTRGGDFDGQFVLLANRTSPKLLHITDLLNNNANNPILLNTMGIEGGVHPVSAGRLSHGHIYLVNLTTAVGGVEDGQGNLKVYHYSNPMAAPEVVLSWDGKGLTNEEYEYAARLGDNISVNLDEAGNGYVFFAKQEADNVIFRFTVKNFTDFSEPYAIELPSVANYYGMCNQVGPDQYLYTSSYSPMLWLLDHNGTVLQETEWGEIADGQNAAHACDPRVITFNRSRYLVMTNARRFGWWAPETLWVFDISEGNDMVAAMVKIQEHLDVDPEDESTGTPWNPAYSYVMDSETISSACVALTGVAEVDGKLLIFTAAPHVGFAIIEVPKK